ncbi:hypothetical protein [Geodermatophilus amargosae]|uniref:hypothetical protein n=1 Tax=Geodermatophilus amargosae TaxID=1296565 RepID=UPI001C315911|nr:hypothetical protein [Geodermatophilus amargosae]
MTEIPVRGPFDLARSARFLEGFAPARHPGAPGGVLRLACWVEGSDTAVGVAVTQDGAGVVMLRTDAEPPPGLAGQVARILGLDVDGADSARVTAADRVLAPLAAARPGFRPVGFWSP